MQPESALSPLVSTKAEDPVIGPLVAEYLVDLRAIQGDLVKSIGRDDWASVFEIAHTIKGSGSMYGFDALTSIATEVCDACASEADDRGDCASELVLLCRRATG